MDALKTIPIAAPQIGDEEKRAVLAVLESGQLAQGPVVEDFEQSFARWCFGPRRAGGSWPSDFATGN